MSFYQAIQPHNIEVQIPDEFLCRLWELDAGQIAEVLREQAASLRNPPRTALEVLANLGRAMPRFGNDRPAVETAVVSILQRLRGRDPAPCPPLAGEAHEPA
jgi:hypothetical protein